MSDEPRCAIELASLDEISGGFRTRWSCLTYESHQFPHGPFDIQDVGALDSHQTALHPKWWEKNVRAVIFDDLTDLVESLKQDAVELGISHNNRFYEDLGAHDEIMKLLLSMQNIFRSLSGDEHLVFWSPDGAWRAVTV